MKNARRKKIVSFRVDEEAHAEIDAAATVKGQTVSDFCHDLVIGMVQKGDYFSHVDRLIYEELTRVRFLIGAAFNALTEGRIDPAEWKAIKERVNEDGDKIAKMMLDASKLTTAQIREVQARKEQKEQKLKV